MAIEKYLFEEWAPDVSDFEQQGMELVENAVPIHRVYRELSGDTIYNSLSGLSNMAAVGFNPGTRPFEVISAVPAELEGVYTAYEDSVLGTQIYHFDPATAVNTNVSNAIGYGALNAFRFTQFGSGNIMATSIFAPLQVLNTSLATKFAAAITTPAAAVDRPQMRYICRIGGKLVGGFIFVSGSFFGARFHWCRTNDFTDWEPAQGPIAPGWAELSGEDGAITGLEGWDDFGLIFTEYGLHKIVPHNAYVFQRTQIGGPEHGKDFFSDPVKYGRDCYYWSRHGIKVVRDGEYVESISDSRTTYFLVDRNRNPLWARKKDTAVLSVVSSHWDSICFLYRRNGDDGAATADLDDWCIAVYNVAEDQWGYISTLEATINGSTTFLSTSDWALVSLRDRPVGETVGEWPLDDIGLIRVNSTAGLINLRSLDDPDDNLPYRLTGRNYKGLVGERTSIKRVRPLIQLASNVTQSGTGGGFVIPGAGDPRLEIQYTDDFNHRQDLKTFSMGDGTTVNKVHEKDRNGFWLPEDLLDDDLLPIKGGSFRFSLFWGRTAIRGLADSNSITESSGVEVDIEKAGRGG